MDVRGYGKMSFVCPILLSPGLDAPECPSAAFRLDSSEATVVYRQSCIVAAQEKVEYV